MTSVVWVHLDEQIFELGGMDPCSLTVVYYERLIFRLDFSVQTVF
jgi:hypothetical protein